MISRRTSHQIAVTALMLSPVLSGCYKMPQMPQEVAPKVTVGKPVVKEVTDYFEFTGRTSAIGEVEIRARVTGYLEKICFIDGQDVKKGDLLFVIDPRPYEAALDRAKGELARLLAVCDKAKADLARSERLRPSGAVSEDEYEQRVSTLVGAKASIQTAQAAVRDAELNLEFTKIESPIDGRVSRRLVTEGNLIQQGTQILTTVVTSGPLYVYFDITSDALLKYARLASQNERLVQLMHASRVKEANIPVEVQLQDEENFPHKGVLDFVDNQMDSSTAQIRARAIFENKDRLLTPGLFVRVRIPYGQPHDAILVDEKSIISNQRDKCLMVVAEEGGKQVAQFRKVQLGGLHDGYRAIENGIGKDDTIIVNGLLRVKPGMPVDPHAEGKSETAIAQTPQTVESSTASKDAASKN